MFNIAVTETGAWGTIRRAGNITFTSPIVAWSAWSVALYTSFTVQIKGLGHLAYDLSLNYDI